MTSTEHHTLIDSHPRSFRLGLGIGILAIVLCVGLIDFKTGFELNFFAFYLIPVILAVWFLRRGFGIFVSALCVGVSTTGDLIAGARYSSKLVPAWNAAISLTFFLVVVWILSKLRSLHSELEARVRQRTAALQHEMQERRRLEEEILNISEQEQQRIGRDLHDSLSQHLTGVALACEVLSEQLEAKSLPEAKAINNIVGMVEGAIELTRTLARGLHPFELKGEGFTDALRELAANITGGHKMSCVFECASPVMIDEPSVAMHLFRIAQEAITNAVKHSKAKEIVVRLHADDGGVMLTISDDGVGVPTTANPSGQGMGLRTMAYRASVIGASFKVERNETRGTRVTCKLPSGTLPSRIYAEKS